jgi:apolipoprotein N-acyltransferase
MSGRMAGAVATAALVPLVGRPDSTGLLACVALVPLLLALRHEPRPDRAALLAAIAWSGVTISAYEGVLVIRWWAFFVLVGLASIVPAVAGAAHAWTLRRSGPAAAGATFVATLVAVEALARHPGLLAGTVGWSSLAFTQSSTPLVAAAAWSGVSTVTAWIAVANLAIVLVLAPGRRRVGLTVVAVLAASTLALPIVPATTLAADDAPATPPLRVGVVQAAGNRADMLMARFDPRAADRTMSRFAALTRDLPSDLDVVVWGETVLPTPVRDGRPDPVAAEALRSAPRILVGGRERADGAWFNSIFLASDTGLTTAYRKRRPVPVIEEGFARGPATAPLDLGGRRLGIAICLETTYSDLARELVGSGADVLVYHSDDTFAGRTFTAEAHLRTAAFRAAETGVPVVFANESGPSALIGPRGELLVRTALGQRAAISATLPGPAGPTPFVRWGDWLAITSAIVAIVLLLRASRPIRRAHL